jgi:acyl-CoA:acyl-CoA alkyltransferase
MKIAGIAATLPSRIVTNDDILDLVRHHSKERFTGDLPKTLKIIDRLFEKSGIESRHWLAQDEQPMALLEDTFNRALAQANIGKEDIDLLIYTGVARGFIEPANSCFVAKALGLTCRNFDVLDACMGWVSSMELVNDKMKAGAIRYAVIVNMEFNMVDGTHIFPKNFALESASELDYKFPSLTIGEAATVTILNNEEPDNFKFSFVSRPDLSDLCTISLPGWESFCKPSSNILPTGGMYQFSSRGGELHEMAEIEAVNVFNQQELTRDDIHCVVTHTSSPKQWMHYGRLVNIADKIHSVAHKTGNVVTASIPLGIVDAIEQGSLKKNDVCLGWKGSAGMAFSAMTFMI